MRRYQDYVIKEGKFIGEFEKMYKEFDDPWHQREVIDSSYSRYVTPLSIKTNGINSLVDVGCGLGAFTAYVSQVLPDLKIVGMDISETAVTKARKEHPNIRFLKNDLLTYSKQLKKHDIDALLLSEIMWYILNDLDEIVVNITDKFRDKFIIINQTFYKGQQEYGNEFFTNLEELINYLPWKCIHKLESNVSIKGTIETHSVFLVN